MAKRFFSPPLITLLTFSLPCIYAKPSINEMQIFHFYAVPWYETQIAQFALISLFAIGCLGMAYIALFVPLVEQFTRSILGIIGLLNASFLIGIRLLLVSFSQWDISQGLPLAVNLLLVLPVFTAMLSIVLFRITFLAWIRGHWNTTLRVVISILTFMALGFIPFLVYLSQVAL